MWTRRSSGAAAVLLTDTDLDAALMLCAGLDTVQLDDADLNAVLMLRAEVVDPKTMVGAAA